MRPGRSQAGISLMEILIALVLIGIGVGVFIRMQKSSGSNMAGTGKMMRAGQLVEKHIEAIRISIARDTLANWPPGDTAYSEGGLMVVRRISGANSPKTGAPLANVRKVDLVVTWGNLHLDSLDVSTYVTRKF
jgi:Tfp pilus assembly protein PilV